MTGDPGALAYIDSTNDKCPSDEKKPYLILEGCGISRAGGVGRTREEDGDEPRWTA